MDSAGQPIYSRTTESGTRYYTVDDKITRVSSPNKPIDSPVGQNAARGKVFEQVALSALGINKNTQRLVTQLPDGSKITIIPDAIKGKTFIEIKDARYISMSDQLRGYFGQKRPIDLIVSPRTKISQTVKKRIDNTPGSSIKVYDPATGKFTSWE